MRTFFSCLQWILLKFMPAESLETFQISQHSLELVFPLNSATKSNDTFLPSCQFRLYFLALLWCECWCHSHCLFPEHCTWMFLPVGSCSFQQRSAPESKPPLTAAAVSGPSFTTSSFHLLVTFSRFFSQLKTICKWSHYWLWNRKQYLSCLKGMLYVSTTKLRSQFRFQIPLYLSVPSAGIMECCSVCLHIVIFSLLRMFFSSLLSFAILCCLS